MYRFWNPITRPLLEILQPQLLMEIGVSTGNQTIHLLEFAKEHGAVLHAVDPEVIFPLQDFETRFSSQFRFHQTTSIEAIAALPRCDVYLIDGDHNWYTVFHELEAIGAMTKKQHPVVLLHDTDWPYGRRDQYTNPNSIPEEGRKPYIVSGITPGQSDLDIHGINPWCAHAMSEGGERNGVLTAIEQYIAASPVELSCINIQGMHGYSIVYPRILETQNPIFYTFLTSLIPAQPIANIISEIDKDRLQLLHATQKNIQERKKIDRNNALIKQKLLEAIAELAHLQSTRSWRMTAPLRILEERLRIKTKNLPQIIIHDLYMVWSAMGSPFPIPIRFIRHRILGQLLPANPPIIQDS